jgi:hypothetical protein
MLPNNEVRVPQPLLGPEALVPRDITEHFTKAASSELIPAAYCFASDSTSPLINEYLLELRAGELVKDGFFTLFEAVGALEVRSIA